MTKILLDVSRTISRMHLPYPTGIDRVERSYIDHLSQNHSNAFAVARMGSAYLICNLAEFRVFGSDYSGSVHIGLIDKFRLKLSIGQRQTKTAIRRRFGWVSKSKFLTEITGQGVTGCLYINVGHSRALAGLWEKMRAAEMRHWFMIHDVIPLTHPDLTRPDTPKKFGSFVEHVEPVADRVIFVSDYSSDVGKKYFPKADMVVAAPGVALPQASEKPKIDAPYILAVGTVEPRKNYDLLFDIWQDPPLDPKGKPYKLVIVGQKGWASPAMFDRIEDLIQKGHLAFLEDVNDADLAALYEGCSKFVFPSWVEGFGIPLYEAMLFGKPILASDIPVFRKALGPDAPLLKPDDRAEWENALKSPENSSIKTDIPTWAKHFDKVGL